MVATASILFPFRVLGLDWVLTVNRTHSFTPVETLKVAAFFWGNQVSVDLGYIPGIIMSAVYSDSVTKAGKCSVQLLCQNKLMTQQSVSISKAWVHLRRQMEELIQWSN